MLTAATVVLIVIKLKIKEVFQYIDSGILIYGNVYFFVSSSPLTAPKERVTFSSVNLSFSFS